MDLDPRSLSSSHSAGATVWAGSPPQACFPGPSPRWSLEADTERLDAKPGWGGGWGEMGPGMNDSRTVEGLSPTLPIPLPGAEGALCFLLSHLL